MESPYGPGAGVMPPLLVGRDMVRSRALELLVRTEQFKAPGRSPLILTGVRGVGKTVTLRSIAEEAGRRRFVTAAVTATRHGALAAQIAVTIAEQVAQTKGIRADRRWHSGATRWIGGNPLIVLSSRHKAADVFWFTLFHELGHVLLHPKRSTYVDLDGKAGDDDDGLESEANEFAAETLIPAKYDQAICSAPIAELPDIARKLEIDVCIVAGRRARMLNTPRQWQLVHKFRPNIDTAALENLYA